MAYTAEQEFHINLEEARRASARELEGYRNRFEAVRIAKEVLMENARNRPSEERNVTAEDILAFANKLTTYVDA